MAEAVSRKSKKELEAEVRDLLEALDFCRRTMSTLHARSWSSGWIFGSCQHMLDKILDRPEAQAILHAPKRMVRDLRSGSEWTE
jgi:hypothetical protein